MLRRMAGRGRHGAVQGRPNLPGIDQTAKWTEIFAQMAEAKGKAHPDAAVQQMVSTLSEHALRQEKEIVFHEIEKPEFIPMPKHGPFKLLRKKLATACKLLLVGK